MWPMNVSQDGPILLGDEPLWNLFKILRTTSLSMLVPNAMLICIEMRQLPKRGFRCFISSMASIIACSGPFGPVLFGVLFENSKRYLSFTRFRWDFSEVVGFTAIAIRPNHFSKHAKNDAICCRQHWRTFLISREGDQLAAKYDYFHWHSASANRE